jgi:hypothetical protein
MTSQSPTHTYYQRAIGRWRGRIEAQVTDRRELMHAVGFFNGLSVWMMAAWPGWLGSMFLETTVVFDEPNGRVEHTTTVRWCRLPMMRSVETVSLDDNGTQFRLKGIARNTLMPWLAHPVTGSGRVDDAAQIAHYKVSWFGATLTQETNLQDASITLSQKAPGFRASQVLKRLELPGI